MGEVIDFQNAAEARRGAVVTEDCVTGQAICLACSHRFDASAPVGHLNMRCPACETYRAVWLGMMMVTEPHLSCGCGVPMFHLLKSGLLRCVNCGSSYELMEGDELLDEDGE